MLATRHPGLALSDAQLALLLSQTEGLKRVELKLTVPALDHRSTVAALGMDPLDARIEQLYLLDTPDLMLDRNGIVLRARRVQGKKDDSAVTVRPLVPDELPAELRGSADLSVEVDAGPGGYVCSATLRSTPKTNVRQAVAQERPPRGLFTKEQRALIATRLPEGTEAAQLSSLGPIFGLRLRCAPPDGIRRMVAELWLYPNAPAVLELSMPCEPGDVLAVAGAGRAFLARHGVDISGESHAKTRKALQFFAKRLTPSRQDVPPRP